MTIASLPALGDNITVTQAAKVLLFGPNAATPLLTLPINTKTLIIQNLDSTNFIYVRFTLSALAGNLTDGIRINPNTALTLDIGVIGFRMDPDVSGFYCYAQADTADVACNIVRVNQTGAIRAIT
jgi:hypothetical protein